MKIKVEKITGKSINELIQENNDLVEYIDNCYIKGENGEEYFPKDFDFEKHGKSLERYQDLQEIIKFHNAQQRKMQAEELRAEVNKNRRLILKFNDNCCYVCGLDFVDILVIHHIVQISDGGNNDLDNLAVLCPLCHAVIHKAIPNSTLDYEFLRMLENYFVKHQLDKIHNLALMKSKNPTELLKRYL